MQTPIVSSAKRALVVDRDPVNLEIIATLTRQVGFLVDTARTAEEALQRLASNVPVLIICDLLLPGMNGLDLTRAVKRNPAWKSIQVILLTSDDSADHELSARQAGCDCLIGKPVDAKLFPSLIAPYLGMPAADVSSVEELPIEELRKRFLADASMECRDLLAGFAASRLFVPVLDFGTIRLTLRHWAEVAGTLGFPGITRKAKSAEMLLASPGPGMREDLRSDLIELLDLFKTAVPLQPLPGPPKPSTVFATVAAAKPVVLVADGDPTVRGLIKLSLEGAGLDCRLADNGALACTMAMNAPPDAIVLDLSMPRVDGIQVLYSLRSHWSTRYIPVLLLSSHVAESVIVEAARLGAAHYLTKPFEISDLLARILSMIPPRSA